MSDLKKSENKENQENQEKLQCLFKELIYFSTETISGQLSAAYKYVIEKRDISILKNFKVLYPMFCAQYLNKVYTTLIKKDDDSIVNVFKKFKTFCSHSEVCLIHIIKSLCELMVQSLDFEKCNFSGYDIFMSTCRTQLFQISEKIDKMPSHLSTQCKGVDISTCDPNKELFVIEIEDKNISKD